MNMDSNTDNSNMNSNSADGQGGGYVAVGIDCNCSLYDDTCNSKTPKTTHTNNSNEAEEQQQQVPSGTTKASSAIETTVTKDNTKDRRHHLIEGDDDDIGDGDDTTINNKTEPTTNSADNNSSTLTFKSMLSEVIPEMIAELSGTFVIVQLGTGAVMSAIYPSGGGGLTDLISIAIVWMIAVTIAISISASISGAHLNPAITMAFVIVRRGSMSWYKVIPYITAQFIGAILASIVNLYIYHDMIQQYELANDIIRDSSNSIPSAKTFGEYFSTTVMRAFFVEAFGTFVLAVVVFSLTHPKNDLIHNKKTDDSTSGNGVFIPPLIGCTVGALISTLAPITQAGFNPARDFGPRFVAYFAGWRTVAFLPQHSWLVYMIGPIVGAVLGAAYVDCILFRPKKGAL
jgi:glycerol uptake facilitator protein